MVICLWILAFAGDVVAVTACYTIVQKDKRIEEISFELKGYKKELYVAARDLYEGEILTVDCVRKERRYTDTDRAFYMSDEDLGKVLTADIREGECLMKHTLAERTVSLRQAELTEIEVPAYLQTGNRVDVRISFGNAEDYIVLSEKLLISCDEKKGIVLEMTEEEILTLSSALLDCQRYENTKLYLVKYPEYRQMPQSEVNYVAAAEILVLLGKEEMEVERAQLEERLSGLRRR